MTSIELIVAWLRELADRLQPDCQACTLHNVCDEVVLLLQEAGSLGAFSDPRFIGLRNVLSEKHGFVAIVQWLNQEHGGLPPMPKGWGWRIGPDTKEYVRIVVLALAALVEIQCKTQKHGRRAKWQSVMSSLESMADQGLPCPSREKLAAKMKERFKSCSVATVQKAFDNSSKLRAWGEKRVLVRQTRKQTADSTLVMTDAEIQEAIDRIIESTPEGQRPRVTEELKTLDPQKLAEILPEFDPSFANER